MLLALRTYQMKESELRKLNRYVSSNKLNSYVHVNLKILQVKCLAHFSDLIFLAFYKNKWMKKMNSNFYILFRNFNTNSA